jgi:hypothetical protein
MAMDAATMVRAYIRIRDARSALKKEFDAQDGALKESLKKIEMVMLGTLTAQNANSVKTSEGQFYRQVDVIPTATDWTALYAWIRENDAFDALEKRVKKTFISDYMESNDGNLPPGVSVLREYVVRVRRDDKS